MKKSLFLIEVFIIAFLSPLSKEERFNEILPTYSYIELTINGTGNTSIFYINENNENCQGVIPPDEIQINDETSIQNPNMMQYLNNEKNYVKLIWNNKRINSLRCLFYNCQNISYVDFTHFDSSLVESVSSLFNGCTKLTSANFNNFNPSIIIDMHWMFHNCNYLKSIDLSNFDTSKVRNMNSMFNECKSLTNLNLNNFYTRNLKNMENMFKNCILLEELFLSNCIICNVENMSNLFYNCFKLKTLDISNFELPRNIDYKNIFTNMNITCNIKTNDLRLKKEFNNYIYN
jgi:surface protein